RMLMLLRHRVVFSTALAVGSMITSGEDLIDALLGKPGALSRTEIVVGLAAAALVIGFVVRSRDALVVALVSPDIARTAGVNVSRLNLLYLQMFALTVALGLRYLGVLLMGSLIIIPAATAKRVSANLAQMLIVATAAAVAATLAGSAAASWLHRESGPLIVAAGAVGFVLTLLRRTAGAPDHDSVASV
ncbi:MAG TPA: metal ABC transporter permease, partial [Vicinamibacterales bacterium]|nr:metal ABC transporter permease [Vicinamibacterales bacterium]